jgi:hypothetical protein
MQRRLSIAVLRIDGSASLQQQLHYLHVHPSSTTIERDCMPSSLCPASHRGKCRKAVERKQASAGSRGQGLLERAAPHWVLTSK